MDSCHYRSIRTLAFTLVAALLAPAPALTQTPCPANRPGRVDSPHSIRLFHLKNVAQQNDANEIMVALRNMLDPTVKIYLVNSDNTIVMDAPPEQLELAQRLVTELDRPHKLYRLTFTLADLDAGKTVAVRHATMVIAAGQRTTLKQGTRVPAMTTVYDSNGSTPQKLTSNYIDVGLSLDATITEDGNGLSVRSKVEQSTLPAGATSAATQEPMVHQAVLEGTSSVALGKTVILGTMDLPDSTHRMEVEVMAEPVS